MKQLRSFWLTLALTGAGLAQQSDPFAFLQRLGDDFLIQGLDGRPPEFERDAEHGIIRWRGGVHIKLPDQSTEIFCDRAEYYLNIEEIRLLDDVVIYRQGTLFRGERATYRVRSSDLDTSGMSSSSEPLFYSAATLSTNIDDMKVVETERTAFTTDDNPDPDWTIRANRVTVYPQDRIVFRQPKLYLGDVPVFWLPYLSQPLQEDLGYEFTPGYSTQWGAYWLNSYGTLWGDHSIVQFLLDGRTERGLAGGINLLSTRWRQSKEFGKFQLYYANDSAPQKTAVSSRGEDRDNSDTGRYRVNFRHRVYLPGPEESTLYLDFDVNKISDEYFLEDFFATDYRLDPQPDNFITLTKQHERGEANLMARFRANDFYQSDTRLPEVSLDFTRQPLFNTGLFYWGNTSAGLYRERISERRRRELLDDVDELQRRLASDLSATVSGDLALANTPASSLLREEEREEARTLLDDLKFQLEPNGFTRLYSYHELLYPITSGPVSFVPKIGAGLAHYSDVKGPAPDTSTRGIFHAGFDLSTKASRHFSDLHIPSLGVDTLLHVIQPYVSYSFLSSDNLGSRFRGIDRLALSSRPRTLDVPQFTAVDSLNSWNILRVGIENRFITRRGRSSTPWLTANTYFDTFLEDPQFNRDFSNLYQDIAWYPLPWLRMTLDAQLPVFGGDMAFTEVNTGFTFMPTRNFEFNISHRFLHDDPFFVDSNVVRLRTYLRLNDSWGFGTSHRYEFEDSTLESQEYSLHRDLNTWSAALAVLLRDHRGATETGIVLSFTLKDFPRVSLPLGMDAIGGD